MEKNPGYEFDVMGQKIVVQNQAEADLATLAIELVNDKLAEIRSAQPRLGPQQVCVLALLEMAGNLIKDRKLIDDYRLELDRKCSSLLDGIKKRASH